jgi:hypothetical protein
MLDPSGHEFVALCVLINNRHRVTNLDAIIQLDEWMFKNGLNEVQQNELEHAVKYVAGQYVSAVSEAIERAQAEAKAEMMHIVRKTGTMAMTHAVREWGSMEDILLPDFHLDEFIPETDAAYEHELRERMVANGTFVAVAGE